MKTIFEKYSLEIVAMTVAFFTPIAYAILYCSFLVMADLITGILKNKKMQGREFFYSSRGFFQSFSKWLLYTIGLVTAQGAVESFDISFDLPKMVLSGIAFIEIKSMDENMSEVLGYSIFNKILSVVQRSKNIHEEQKSKRLEDDLGKK